MITLALLIVQTDFVLDHVRRPRYDLIRYEAACGTQIFEAAFRNDAPDPRKRRSFRSRVEVLKINSIEVRGATKWLQNKAAGRYISRISVSDCGYSDSDPIFNGLMQTSPAGLIRLGHSPNVVFTISRTNGSWQLTPAL